MADVFISYSRHDTAFVRELHAFLTAAGRDVWVDWEDIPAAAEWEQDIDDSIDAAESFVFVVSSSSLASKYCATELQHAQERGKRIVPIACEAADPSTASQGLRQLNWIWCRPGDDREAAFDRLSKALDTDLEWARAHTRLLVRAVEWEASEDDSLLLRGRDLAQAERELTANAANEPTPTELQQRYVRASRGAASTRQRLLLGGVTAALVVSLALGIAAYLERNSARTQRDTATSLVIGTAADRLTTDDFDVALLLRLAAYRIRPTVQARNGMISALETVRSSGVRTILRTHQGRVLGVAFATEGSTLASAGGDGTVTLWTRASTAGLHNRSTVANAPCWTSRSRRTVIRSRPPEATGPCWCGTFASRASRVSGCPVARGTHAASRSRRTATRSRPPATTGRCSSVTRADPRIPASSSRAVRLRSGESTSRPTGTRSPPQGRTGPCSSGTRRAPRSRNAWAAAREPCTTSPSARTGARSLPPATTGRLCSGTCVRPGSPAGASTGARERYTASRSALTDACSPRRAGWARSSGMLAPPLASDRWTATRDLSTPSRSARTEAPSLRRARTGRWCSGTHAPGPGSRDPWTADRARCTASRSARTARRSPRRATTEPSCCGDAQRPGEPRRLTGHEGRVRAVAFSPDGGTLASAGADGTVRLWDPSAPGKSARVLDGHDGPVFAVAFSPDGTTLAAAGSDGTVRLWDDDGKPMPPLEGSHGPVRGLAFAADGHTVAAANDDGTVLLSDIGAPTEPGSLLRASEPNPFAQRYVYGVAISPRGDTLASAGIDGTVRLWDAHGTGGPDRRLRAGQSHVRAVAFSPDGSILASGGEDGTLVLWDTATGSRLGQRLSGHQGQVLGVAFGPDGSTLATAGEDGTVLLWRGMLWTDVDDLAAQVCSLVAGDLTRDEWNTRVPGLPYRSSCSG